MEDCLFCKIVKGDVSVEKIYENENFISFPDANQQIEGHSLVIPKKHYVDTLDLPAKLGGDLLDCIQKTAKKVLKAEDVDGFNIVSNNSESAGQAVMHAHFHILPRKKGGKVPRVY